MQKCFSAIKLYSGANIFANITDDEEHINGGVNKTSISQSTKALSSSLANASRTGKRNKAIRNH